MSKVNAYICDCCGQLCIDTDTVGINPIEDLFDTQLSYPTIFKLDKTNVHYAVSCYKEKVLRKAGMEIDRKKDERAYELKVKELGFNFRSQVVKNWKDKNMYRKKLRD